MISGRCECGTVSFRIDGDITDFSHCHCSQCRRLHGAAYASYAGVSRAAFHYTGGENHLRTYASSVGHDRVFCEICGSNIMVALTSEPSEYYVAMGVVDGDPPLPPAYHIFTGSKAPWHEITDNLPRYETEPTD